MNRQQQLFDLLGSAFDRDSLGHALLFVLPEGGDDDPKLFEVFRRFQALLMCPERKAEQGPCGQCSSCRILISSKLGEPVQHPDFMQLMPEDKAHYAVEEVRAMIEGFSLTRSLSPNRIAWIPRADLLSAGGQTGAANALLKVLEEPRPHSFLILTTSRPAALLTTIRSRCQIFRLPRLDSATPQQNEAADELKAEWGRLLNWLQSGAQPGAGPDLAADTDAFWKDREKALSEADRAYLWLWQETRNLWDRWDREQGQRVLRFFSRFEDCLTAIRGYGNPPLQWLSFRSDAKLDR